jgi:hypothetical protein
MFGYPMGTRGVAPVRVAPILYATFSTDLPKGCGPALEPPRKAAGAPLRGCDVAGHGLDPPFHHARLFSSAQGGWEENGSRASR